MNKHSETNCWRPAVWTLTLLIGIILLAGLFGGFEPSAVAAK